jgi:4'-phosphopantetheinyl transferase
MDLAEDEVHLWLLATDEPCDLASLRELLADDERAKADRFRFERDCRRSIVRRAKLRQIVAQYVGSTPGEMRFRYGPRGKPTLDAPFDQSGVEFNLSFSGEQALIAIGRRPLGVDLEQCRIVDNAELVAKHFFSQDEILVQNAADDANQVFLRHWTRKEALIKATGSGLSVPLNSFDVSWLPDDADHEVTLPDAEGNVATWYVRDLSPSPGFLAALAAVSPVVKVRWQC